MKNLFLILICFLLPALTCQGAGYEVRPLPLPEGACVVLVYDNNLLIKNEQENSYGLADLDGNMLTELKYYQILPHIEGESFIGYTRAVYYPGDEEFERLYAEREKGNTKISFSSVDEKAQLSYERLELIDKKGRIISADEYENGREFSPFTSGRISGRKLKKLFNNNYTIEHNMAFDYPGFVILKGEDSYAAVNCINGNIAMGKNLVILGNGSGDWQFALETEKGKYLYCTPETVIYREMEFDSYSAYMGRFVFKSGEEYFGFDENGRLAYRGTKEICGVYGDEFVVKKGEKYILTDHSFNQVVPGEFDEIITVRHGVYNLREGEKSHLINGRKKVIADMKSIGSAYYYGYFPCYTATGKQLLYDVEGRMITEISADALALINGGNVHLGYYGKSECIIPANGNPSVKINGKALLSDSVCRMDNDRIFVPLRAFVRQMGYTLSEDGREFASLDELSAVFGFGYSWNGETKTAEINTGILHGKYYSPASIEAVSGMYSGNGERRMRCFGGVKLNLLQI